MDAEEPREAADQAGAGPQSSRPAAESEPSTFMHSEPSTFMAPAIATSSQFSMLPPRRTGSNAGAIGSEPPRAKKVVRLHDGSPKHSHAGTLAPTLSRGTESYDVLP